MNLFWVLIILANVWIAASYATKDSSKTLYCLAIGVFWLLFAMVYKLFS